MCVRVILDSSISSLLKKGSDPLETLLIHGKKRRSERVRPLFQQAVRSKIEV